MIEPNAVMAGLVPAIHAAPSVQHVRSVAQRRGVDGRDKPGHDGERGRCEGSRSLSFGLRREPCPLIR